VAERIGPLDLGPAIETAELDRYLDTADGRMAAAGWACRLRSRHGGIRISLKGPPAEGTAGALHRRPEVEGPASAELDPAAWPGSAARVQLLALSGGGALVERLSLDQLRTERAVTLAGSPSGTLSLDDVRVTRDGVERGHFRVVELELDVGALRDGLDLAPLLSALEAIPGLRVEPRTKLERALALLDAG
jgi:inorganic triphosphatase YgiF